MSIYDISYILLIFVVNINKSSIYSSIVLRFYLQHSTNQLLRLHQSACPGDFSQPFLIRNLAKNILRTLCSSRNSVLF